MFVLCMDHMVKDVEGREELGQSQRGAHTKQWVNKGWDRSCSYEVDLSVFGSRGWLFLLASNLLLHYLIASFSCSLCIVMKSNSYSWRKAVSDAFPLWALLRSAIVGLITSHKCPLLELSPQQSSPPPLLLSNQLKHSCLYRQLKKQLLLHNICYWSFCSVRTLSEINGNSGWVRTKSVRNNIKHLRVIIIFKSLEYLDPHDSPLFVSLSNTDFVLIYMQNLPIEW